MTSAELRRQILEDSGDWPGPRNVLMEQYGVRAIVPESFARAALSGHGAPLLSRDRWSCSPHACYRIVETIV
jgi:hypothetical protein